MNELTFSWMSAEEEAELNRMTLEELAGTARADISGTQAALLTALERTRHLGAVLLTARPKCPHGEWERWLAGLGLSPGRASASMRISKYWDHVPNELRSSFLDVRGARRPPSITAARRSLDGLPPIDDRSGGSLPHPSHVRSLALDMRNDGASWSEISRTTGVDRRSIRKWVDPEGFKVTVQAQRVRNYERAAAKAALEKERKRAERDALARTSTNKDLANAYSLVRRLNAVLAIINDNPIIDQAYHAATTCEAAIVRKLRQERTTDMPPGAA